MDDKDDSAKEQDVELIVKRSPISGSGIARVNSEVVETDQFEEGGPVYISFQGRKRVLRLVADGMMEKGMISIRDKDMSKLGVKSGEKILLQPYTKVGHRLTKKLFHPRK